MGWKWKKWKDMIPYTSCLCFGRKQWQPINDDDEEESSVSDLCLSLGQSVCTFKLYDLGSNTGNSSDFRVMYFLPSFIAYLSTRQYIHSMTVDTPEDNTRTVHRPTTTAIILITYHCIRINRMIRSLRLRDRPNVWVHNGCISVFLLLR